MLMRARYDAMVAGAILCVVVVSGLFVTATSRTQMATQMATQAYDASHNSSQLFKTPVSSSLMNMYSMLE
jgi:hypothetical protein